MEKSKKRTPAQKWRDGQFDLINKKCLELWDYEPKFSDMVAWLKFAEKSVGLVIVGLNRLNAYEKKNGILFFKKSFTAWLRSDFRRRNYYTDTELEEIKKIDRDYEAQYKTKTNVSVIGQIFRRMK